MRRVGKVVRLYASLEPEALGESEVFEKRQVNIRAAGAAQNIASRGAGSVKDHASVGEERCSRQNKRRTRVSEIGDVCPAIAARSEAGVHAWRADQVCARCVRVS